MIVQNPPIQIRFYFVLFQPLSIALKIFNYVCFKCGFVHVGAVLVVVGGTLDLLELELYVVVSRVLCNSSMYSLGLNLSPAPSILFLFFFF